MSRLAPCFEAERMERDLARVRRFWTGEGRCLATITPGSFFRPRQDLSDDDQLAAWRRGLEALADLPGLNLPSIFPDFGTVSAPRYWGGIVVADAESGRPFIQPAAANLDEALALAPRAVNDPSMDAARALRLHQRFCELIGNNTVWFRSPDLQGALNTAGMILQQEELLMGMVHEPEKTRLFLDRVGDFILSLWQWLRRECGGRLCGNIWPYTFLPADLGISLTEDMMPLLSPELYAQFGIPLLRKLDWAAGGLQIHCCGKWGRHASTLASAGLRLRAMEFHYPYTKIEELASLAGQTVLVPYFAPDKQTQFRDSLEYYRYLLDQTDERFRFWFALCEDTKESRQFVEEVEERGLSQKTFLT